MQHNLYNFYSGSYFIYYIFVYVISYIYIYVTIIYIYISFIHGDTDYNEIK